MQYSKSFAYFALPDQQRQPSTQTRALRRSSLDTFIIPGRTRLPSSKTSTFDLLLTQGLLNSNPPQPPGRTMTSTEKQAWSPETSPTGCMTRRGANSGSSDPLHQRARPDIVKRPPPRFGGREVIIVPPQRPRPRTHQPAPQALAPRSLQEYVNGQKYDGADDSNTESRLTSTTWSTVSQRFFSDSSGSSRTQGASYYRDEYNKLAEKHGLPRLEATLDRGLEDENHSQTKTTTKTHHAGWLARKLFRRTSSTYTLKAKTIYKPISKKKSFGGISVLSEGHHKNILKGKSLEELSRLGGLSVLILPPDFAVDKLTLPTCLSATATYLYQNGCNAPGIFRVSGQATIVNALYDYYDHQFANVDAGSPSKVEQTVGSGLLPSHIEHTVPDVASFFKRVLIDLPGGLLGSVELFEALRNITMNVEHDHDLSELELASLKAKMIALAISSVTSDYRLYLIQAVLGLVSYLGHEAQKLQAETSSTDEDQGASELMNYKSLGVVMGPLLLGNLTDRAVHDGVAEDHSGDLRTPLETDSGKKFRKHKRKHSDLKLDQNATLAAFVDRANRTALVMQQLLLMWPEVVKQLRDISATASSSLKSGSRRRLKKMPSHTGSRLTLKTSEEEMRFLDILRGRTLPEEFRGGVRMKSAIRVTSRSPMSRGAISPSGGERANDKRAAAPSEVHLSSNSDHTGTSERSAQNDELTVSSRLQFIEETKPLLADEVALGAENRTISDLAMDKMAMGTILPPLEVKRSSSSHDEYLRLVDRTDQTPRNNRKSGSSSETPQTALRDALLMGDSHESEKPQLQMSMRKPLPPIGDAQRAELSCSTSEEMLLGPPSRSFARHERPASPQRNNSSSISSSNSFSSRQARRSGERAIFFQRQSEQFRSPPTKHMDDQAMFPPRQSSLPSEQHLPLKPIETSSTLAEYKAKADTYMSPPRSNVSRKASEVRTERSDVPPKPTNVKALAQRFTEASRAMRKNNEQPNETAIPRIYACVNSLPSPKPMLGIDDPFVSAESSNVSKESLIPKPVREVGRTRASKSLSPPKRAAPKVHTPNSRSAFGIVTDRDAEVVQNNATANASAEAHSGEGQTHEGMNVKSNVVDFSKRPSTQHLDAYHHQRSTESLHHRTSLQETQNEPHSLHNRAISFVELARPISHPRPDSPSLNVYNNPIQTSPRSNSYLNASDALKPLERHGSINATMYREICHLQRLLQQMGEEKEAKDRRIEALEEVQGMNPVSVGVKTRGSFGKGGLHNEVRKAKRELSLWKMRAELAERRLSGLKQLSNQSWGNETVFAEDTGPTERSDFVNEQDSENDMNDDQSLQGRSPDSWKERDNVAESQLIQISRRESPNKEFDANQRHKDSQDFRESRAIMAETQLGQNAPLTRNRHHSERVRTVLSPTTAKVHVAVETENGEEVGVWDWRGAEGRRPDNGDYSLTKDEKEAERGPGAVKRGRGSDDESSDFASALNGYG